MSVYVISGVCLALLALRGIVSLRAVARDRAAQSAPTTAYAPMPPAEACERRPDLRTPQQKAADQTRTNDAWGLR